jgi:hypothetical protein
MKALLLNLCGASIPGATNRHKYKEFTSPDNCEMCHFRWPQQSLPYSVAGATCGFLKFPAWSDAPAQDSTNTPQTSLEKQQASTAKAASSTAAAVAAAAEQAVSTAMGFLGDAQWWPKVRALVAVTDSVYSGLVM